MAFGGAVVPEGHVVRTFRVKVMTTDAKRDRCFALLEDAGDVWAWCIDRFHDRFRRGLPNANSVTEMWPDQRAHGPFGDLTVHCAQDVTKGFSAAFFEAVRRRAGEKARLPLRKRHLVPVTWRKGEFQLIAPAGSARATAAGVDPGIIHPLAVASGDRALLVSGRAVRAEEFLHLQDHKARQRAMARKKAPVRARPGTARQPGSRRRAKAAARQRKAEARNRRVVKAAASAPRTSPRSSWWTRPGPAPSPSATPAESAG